MKKITVLIVAITILITSITFTFSANAATTSGDILTKKISGKITVDGKEVKFDKPFYVAMDTYVYVPASKYYYGMGVKPKDIVTGNNTMTIIKDNNKITLRVNEKKAMYNGEEGTFNTPPLIIKDALYYTLISGTIAEALGFTAELSGMPTSSFTLTLTSSFDHTDESAPNVDATGRSYWSMEGQGIYRVNADGIGFKKIHDDWGRSIHVHGEWIYYTRYLRTVSGNSQPYATDIYKVKTDGTGHTKLTPTGNTQPNFRIIKVTDDWIYYQGYFGDAYGNALLRMRHDGSNNTRLNSIDTSTSFFMDETSIYSIAEKRNGKYELNKYKFDGTSKTLLDSLSITSSASNSYYSNSFVYVADGWVYYFFNGYTDDTSNTYMIKINGTEKSTFTSDRVNVFGISDGKAYYVKPGNQGIFSRKADGTGVETRLVSGNIQRGLFVNPSIINSWICYILGTSASTSYTQDLCRVKIDGTENQNLTNFPAFDTSKNSSSPTNNNNRRPISLCTCGGSGRIECGTCDGEGFITEWKAGALAAERVRKFCNPCNGMGSTKCQQCNGSGIIND